MASMSLSQLGWSAITSSVKSDGPTFKEIRVLYFSENNKRLSRKTSQNFLNVPRKFGLIYRTIRIMSDKLKENKTQERPSQDKRNIICEN